MLSDKRKIEELLPAAVGHDTTRLKGPSAKCSLQDEHENLYSPPASADLLQFLKVQAADMLEMAKKHFDVYLEDDEDDEGDEDNEDDEDGTDDDEIPTHEEMMASLYADATGDADDGDSSASAVHPRDGSKIVVGSKVIAWWITLKGERCGPFDAVVEDFNRDGSLSLLYEDGDRDDTVPLSSLELAVEHSPEDLALVAKVSSLATSSNHKVESVFAIQDHMEKSSPGLNPSVLGAIAGAKYSKLDDWLSKIERQSSLLYNTSLEWALRTETMTQVRRESQNALSAARDAQLQKCQDDKRSEDAKRRRKLEKEALFFARAGAHICSSEAELNKVNEEADFTIRQWAEWYNYQIAIRVNGFGWDDALEGKSKDTRDGQVGFLKTRISMERSLARPTTPVFSTPDVCGAGHEYALTHDARAADDAAKLAEEADYTSFLEASVHRAAEEKTDPKAVAGALKKAFAAITGTAVAAEPAAAKKQRRQTKKKNVKIGYLDGLKKGSFVAVCFKFVCFDGRTRRRWYSAQVAGVSDDFAADDAAPHLDGGSFTVVWHPEFDDATFKEWDAQWADAAGEDAAAAPDDDGGDGDAKGAAAAPGGDYDDDEQNEESDAAVAKASAAADEEDGGGGDDDSEVQNEVGSSSFRKDVRLLLFD